MLQLLLLLLTCSLRARVATCSTALSSVLLMWSPAYMESILPFKLAALASSISFCSPQQQAGARQHSQEFSHAGSRC